MKSTAVAPGKIILTGEHFVVHGAPALVAAVDLHSVVTVEKRLDHWTQISSSFLEYTARFKGTRSASIIGGSKACHALHPFFVASEAVKRHFDSRTGLSIKIDSKIPVAVGLGSSAATAVATIAAVSTLHDDKIDHELIREFAYQSERLIHGTPSGIDQTISTYGGIISYSVAKPFKQILPKRNLSIVVGNSRRTRSTGNMVAGVRRQMESNATFKKEAMNSALLISQHAIRALQIGDLPSMGALMNSNHELLGMVGASTIEVDSLVLAARRAGALGAKMTGAGGGGCMIALCSATKESEIAQAIRRAGGIPYQLSLDQKGVRSWLMN